MSRNRLVQTHTTQQPKPRLKGLQSDLQGMSKPQEYLEFISFMALPRALREQIQGVATQDEFSDKYGINRNTLVAWKKRVGFWDDVQAVRKDFFRERTGDVLLALETACLREGKGADVRVLLTYTGEYSDRIEQEHKVSPQLQEAIEKISQILP